MCGIAGYVDFENKTDSGLLEKMTDRIEYRGPSSSGAYFNKSKVAGLGIRRLSIIDLKTGDQPIKNEDGNVVIVFNGEVYGYKKLREDLIRKGHVLKTKSDTETLVHLYEQFGEDCVEKINGMFAFAIWDEKKERLFIARDRAGIKPLYYYQRGKLLIFGSEPKTILGHPLYKKGIDRETLNIFGYLGFIPGEQTVFSGIKKLLPGHSLIFTRDGIKIKRYFKPQIKEYSNSLDELLTTSVEKQLVSDVPVGVFLSGGLDSSLVTHYVSKFKKLKSFSIGFSEAGFDESKHAKYVADLIGTEHYTEEFTSKDVINLFDEITSKLDEPFADASLFPTYKVNKLARKYVTVVLSGDGGDELFGGYPTYQAHLMADKLSALPKGLIDIVLQIVQRTPNSILNLFPNMVKDYSKRELARIVLSGTKLQNPTARHLYWMRTFFLGTHTLFKNVDENMFGSIIHEVERMHVSPQISVGQKTDFLSYLPDDFLYKMDRASMYNSLEVRVPFLDNDVIDYAFSSKEPHLSFLKTKLQLRKLLAEKLPEIAKRPKRGFGIPLNKWLRSDLKEFSYALITDRKIEKYIDKKQVLKLWNNHQNGLENNGGILWQVMTFSAWVRNWG